MSRRMKVSKCPSDVLTMTNRAIVHPQDFDPKADGKATPGTVAFSLPQDCEATDLRALQAGDKVKPHKVTTGLFLPNSGVIFERMEGATINLTGKSKAKVERTQIINPDWDFSKMGIGGLDTEFNAIFRRAFASRVFPPEIMEQLGN